MHNGCWRLVTFPVGGGSKGLGNASRALSGSVKREKVGTFSISFLAVTLFYAIFWEKLPKRSETAIEI